MPSAGGVLDEIAVGSGGYAGNSFKMPVQMTLIGKSDLIGRISQINPLTDQLFRPANPDLGKVSVGGKTRLGLEHTDQMERAQTRFSRQSGQRDILTGKIFHHPCRRQHGGMFSSRLQERIRHVRMTADKPDNHMQ